MTPQNERTDADIAREIVDSEWNKSPKGMNPYLLEEKIQQALASKSERIRELEKELADSKISEVSE